MLIEDIFRYLKKGIPLLQKYNKFRSDKINDTFTTCAKQPNVKTQSYEDRIPCTCLLDARGTIHC